MKQQSIYALGVNMANEKQRDIILKIMMNLEESHELLSDIVESYKRDEAYKLIEAAHQSVALLLVQR